MRNIMKKILISILVFALVYANSAITINMITHGLIAYANELLGDGQNSNPLENEQELKLSIERDKFCKNDMEAKTYQYAENLIINFKAMSAKKAVIEDISNVFYNGESAIEEEINIAYKLSKINKAQLLSLLGETGNFEIKDKDTSKTLLSLNKAKIESIAEEEIGTIVETVTTGEGEESVDIANIVNEDEFIELQYLAETKNIEIDIIYENTMEINEDKLLELENTKEIGIIESTVLEEITNLETKMRYQEFEEELSEEAQYSEEAVINTEIKKRESKVISSINSEELSTTLENNVQFGITLCTDSTMYDLYKNPKFIIELPEEVEEINEISKEDISILNNKMMNEENIEEDIFTDYTISQKEENGKKYIEISLVGEQLKYAENQLNNVQILVPATIKTNKLLPTTKANINVYYLNENATTYTESIVVESEGNVIYGESGIEVNFVAVQGIITKIIANVDGQIVENNKGEENKLIIGSKETTGTITVIAVNNTGSDITAPKILGCSNNFEEINVPNAQVKYSANQNETIDGASWSDEYLETAKSYLIELAEFKQGERIEYTYNINIPKVEEDTTYNEIYTIFDSEKEIATNSIQIEEKTIKLDVKLETSAGENAVYAGQEFSYIITVANQGETTVEELSIIDILPEEVSLVNEEDLVQWENLQLESGKSIVKRIKVKLNKEFNVSEIENKVEVSAKYLEEKIVKTIQNEIKTSEIDTKLTANIEKNSMIQEIAEIGSTIEYSVRAENKTNSTKNITVTAELPNIFKQESINGKIYVKNDEKEVWEVEDGIDITIDKNKVSIPVKLEANEVKFIEVEGKVDKYISEEVLTKVTIKDGEETIILEDIEKTIAPAVLQVEYGAYKESQNVLSQKIDMDDEDELVYQIKITNLGPSKESVNISGNIKECLKIKSIEYKISDETTILENISNNFELAGKSLDVNETMLVEITVTLLENLKETTTLEGLFEIKGEYSEKSIKMENVVEKNAEGGNEQEEPDGPDEPDEPDNPPEVNYSVKGVAWLDENKNGARELSEKLLKGIKVKLLNLANEVKQETITNSNGEYTFNYIEKGEYIVVFEYDKNQYGLTNPRQSGVSELVNSDAYEGVLNGESIIRTDKLLVIQDLSNIDIGLIEKGIFDLAISTTINKITLKNENESKVVSYDNVNFAKIEIPAKTYIGTTLIIEYDITVSNIGDIGGYVYSIKDILPQEVIFQSELNSDWYQENGALYTVSLTEELINPGEEKTIKLVLTKTIETGDSQTIINVAEIGEVFNEGLLQEKDKENNTSKAEIIVAVKTGQAPVYIGLILVVLGIITSGAYIIKKKVLD